MSANKDQSHQVYPDNDPVIYLSQELHRLSEKIKSLESEIQTLNNNVQSQHDIIQKVVRVRWKTVGELAQKYNVREGTIRQAILRRKIESKKLDKKSNLVNLTSFKKYFKIKNTPSF